MNFKKFLREDSGAIVPMFAVSLVPILSLVGASVDLANLTRAHAQLQIAVDATALAVNHQLHITTVQANIQNKAKTVFDAQTASLEDPNLNTVEYSLADGRVDVLATAKFTPVFMGALGFGQYEIAANAQTVVGDQSIEVALVLDTSGSMAGTKIETLRTAATDFVNILFEAPTASTRVKIAVVPFSGAVAVDPINATADWMDKNALSPVHSENFVSKANRFTLYNEMVETPWKGCVESRPDTASVKHMVKDTLPTTADPSSLFVPMFAPDEPDEANEDDDDKEFANNYLLDNGLTPAKNQPANCTDADKSSTTDAARQKRICKYKGQKATSSNWVSTNTGPNFWCNSAPILPLTNAKTTLVSKITGLTARGFTNIHEGLMWGWRALSPTAPFTEGSAYGTPNVRKYIVLMTDGANTIAGNSQTHNKSEYSAYGYMSKNRLASNTSGMSEWQMQNAMDDRLEAACENVKNDDPAHPEKITVFTIAFQINDTQTLQRLKDCASGESLAMTASSNAELEAAFRRIAQELGPLRLTQ